MHQYVANRNVFIDCLKLFPAPAIMGFRKLFGRSLASAIAVVIGISVRISLKSVYCYVESNL